MVDSYSIGYVPHRRKRFIMSYSGIEHKLRVFISSKCGGKYTIARKSLQKLLDVTGLVETYVFETDPASSEDTQSAYLDYVDNSNLCIFLVDNADGVPPAVLSEEKRAKDKHLRLLYIFCDENKKEPTPMQEDVRKLQSAKYAIAHEFSDIVSKAYDSVMQDVIAVYKKKEELFSVEKSEVEPISAKALITETYSLPATSFSKYPHVACVLTKNILPVNPLNKEDEETSLERLLSEHLQTVIFQKPFDETIIDSICTEVSKENNGEICEVLQLRYQAQKCYYLTKYDECLMLLQQAVSTAINKQGIPTWIANDIAIDIRHVQGRIDERNSTFTLENPGQKLIDTSGEPVYFPYLDRQVENMQEEIAKKYYSQLSISPYTTNWGGLDQIFSPLANAFCIAEMHGSIVQTEITRDRLISIYSMLCILYEDHELLVEYIKYLIINRDLKKLDAVIRTYNQSIDILNGQDIDSIMDCINNMFDPIHQIMSKYLLASRLGYYMSDTAYSALYSELIDYAMRWVQDDKRVYNINTFIFDFFGQNTYRMNGKDIVAFIREVFHHGLKRFYMDCFKVLRSIDFEKITQEDQLKVKQVLLDVTATENEQLFDQYYSSAVIRFCKTTEVLYEDLEAVIAEKYPDFYKHTFLLEMSAQRNQDFSEHIKSYIAEAKSRNETQEMNGTYSGYAYESLDVVYNILKTEEIILGSELLKSIIDAGIETLSSEKQTIQAKRSAVRLLQFVYFRSREQKELWNEIGDQMIANAAVFSIGNEMGFFSKDTNRILSFQYYLFIYSSFEPGCEGLLDQLYSTDSSEAYTIVQFLKIITDFLECAKDQLEDDTLISAFLYYSIFMSQHKERDVKYYATTCLIELTNFENAKRLALIHLSQIMDTGSQAAKIAILTRLGRIQVNEDDSYLRQIINKGKSDSNYLVRFVAARDDLDSIGDNV